MRRPIVLDEHALEIAAVPERFRLQIVTEIAPEQNTELSGLYTSGGNFFTQCEAEGFRRITFFLDRPDVMARYTTTLIADRADVPGAALQRQSGRRGRGCRRAALGEMGRSASEAELSVRAGGGRPRRRARPFPHHVGARHRPRDLGAGGRRGPLRPRDAQPQARDGVGRGAVRAGIRSRRVQHRRRVGLQHGRDGEQGAEYLQYEVQSWRSPRPRPMPTTRTSKPSSRTSISTTGPATASPAATGSSSR